MCTKQQGVGCTEQPARLTRAPPTRPRPLPPRRPQRAWCVRPVSGRQDTSASPPPASAAASAASEWGAGLPSAARGAPGWDATTVNSVSAGLPPSTILRATLADFGEGGQRAAGAGVRAGAGAGGGRGARQCAQLVRTAWRRGRSTEHTGAAGGSLLHLVPVNGCIHCKVALRGHPHCQRQVLLPHRLLPASLGCVRVRAGGYVHACGGRPCHARSASSSTRAQAGSPGLAGRRAQPAGSAAPRLNCTCTPSTISLFLANRTTCGRTPKLGFAGLGMRRRPKGEGAPGTQPAGGKQRPAASPNHARMRCTALHWLARTPVVFMSRRCSVSGSNPSVPAGPGWAGGWVIGGWVGGWASPGCCAPHAHAPLLHPPMMRLTMEPPV